MGRILSIMAMMFMALAFYAGIGCSAAQAGGQGGMMGQGGMGQSGMGPGGMGPGGMMGQGEMMGPGGSMDQDKMMNQGPLRDQDIYGWELMTNEERIEHRNRMLSLKTEEEREEYRLQHHKEMQERARAQGRTLPDMQSPEGGGMDSGAGSMSDGGK